MKIKRYLLIEESKKSTSIEFALPKPTHCGELISQIVKNCPDIEMVESHYTIEGVRTTFKDKFDGQEYTMVLIPKERIKTNGKRKRKNHFNE